MGSVSALVSASVTADIRLPPRELGSRMTQLGGFEWLPRRKRISSRFARSRPVRLAITLSTAFAVISIGSLVASSPTSVSAATASVPANANRVVGIAPTPDDLGYRTLTAGGFIPSYGDAVYVAGLGSDTPFVGINESDEDESGFWVVAADGGVFTLGNAAFYGSMGGKAASSLSANAVTTELEIR
jgi:hypothetical protein